MIRSVGLDKVILPHQPIEQAFEKMIRYVEAMHEISLADAQKDKLRSLLVAAQEMVDERRGGCASVQENPQTPPSAKTALAARDQGWDELPPPAGPTRTS